jgi:transposase-like protein
MPKPRRPFVPEQRWTVEVAREALAAQQRSGLSVHAYARREGLDPQRLYFWRRRLGDSRAGGNVGRVQFVEVHAGAGRQVEVLLRSERVLRVSEGIEPEVLRRLCEALEQPSC